MENNRLPGDGRGPRSGRPVPALSASRAAILDRLRDQPEPLTLAALVAASGLHENTVREHLAALVARRLVRRHRADPSGRGRPAWLYELAVSDPDEALQGGSEYAGLASALAATIMRTNTDPAQVATIAGEEWGREMASARGAAPLVAAEAQEQVLALLDDLGFAPEHGTAPTYATRLTRCPLLQAAHRHPEVVCAVHLGIVRGALQEYGADPTGSELLPFAEAGACLLVLPSTNQPLENQQGPGALS